MSSVMVCDGGGNPSQPLQIVFPEFSALQIEGLLSKLSSCPVWNDSVNFSTPAYTPVMSPSLTCLGLLAYRCVRNEKFAKKNNP